MDETDQAASLERLREQFNRDGFVIVENGKCRLTVQQSTVQGLKGTGSDRATLFCTFQH